MTCFFPRPTQVVKVHDPEKRDTDIDVECSRETTERVQSIERAHEETENTSGQCNLEGCLDINERKEVLSRFNTALSNSTFIEYLDCISSVIRFSR